jgi:hypothetical protein
MYQQLLFLNPPPLFRLQEPQQQEKILLSDFQ